jgi:hypothetical protein
MRWLWRQPLERRDNEPDLVLNDHDGRAHVVRVEAAGDAPRRTGSLFGASVNDAPRCLTSAASTAEMSKAFTWASSTWG